MAREPPRLCWPPRDRDTHPRSSRLDWQKVHQRHIRMPDLHSCPKVHHDRNQSAAARGPNVSAVAPNVQRASHLGRDVWPQRLSNTGDRQTPCLPARSEEHTSELQSLMRISYAVFCLKKKNTALYQNNTKNVST